MKIGYYIHHTTMSAGGIFTYSIAILRELIKSSEIDKLIIITSGEVAERLAEFIEKDKVFIKVVDRKNLFINLRLTIWYLFYIAILLIQTLIPARIFSNTIKQIISNLNPYHKIIASGEIDLLHVPVQYSPIYKTRVPVAITMHDLQEFYFPRHFSFRERLSRKIKNKMAIPDSDHVIVSFDHVKEDITKFFNVAEKKISVCPPPFAENWFVEMKETDWKETARKYDLKKKFLLYPAATWQHKNHIRLLDAIKGIRDDGLDYVLICTGNKTEFFHRVIKKRIDNLNLKEVVHFLGIVPEEDLISLYKNTSLVVIPTLYEAGSGPLYEAMRYQVPVICSDVTSLPDTLNNNEFLFNPNELKELKEKIKQGLTDESFRKRNIENSKARIKHFESLNYVNNFIDVYKEASRYFL